MKKICKLLTIVITFIAFSCVTKAGSLSLSANSTATVGSAVRVKVNISNLVGRFKVTSSDTSVLAGSADDWWESSQTVIFTAKKTGRATITVQPINAADENENKYTTSRSITITVKEKSGNSQSTNDTVDINKKYSSNNYLKSLSIVGYDLKPSFDKDTLKYSVELENSVKSIVIKATTEDENANVKGIGEVNLSEGKNTISITVSAENGNEKVYTIEANVEESKPIIVKIGNKKYRVVKDVDSLKKPENYTETTIKIGEEEVPAFISEVTGYILVGLKNSKGDVSLFIYNPSNGKYTLYNELSFDAISIQYMKPNKIPKGYKKYIIKINDEDVPVYKNHKKNKYALIYGMNLNNGDISWYSYDIKENTIQRYNQDEINNLSVLNNKYLITIVILSISSLMLMLFILILMLKIRNHSRN